MDRDGGIGAVMVCFGWQRVTRWVVSGTYQVWSRVWPSAWQGTAAADEGASDSLAAAASVAKARSHEAFPTRLWLMSKAWRSSVSIGSRCPRLVSGRGTLVLGMPQKAAHVARLRTAGHQSLYLLQLFSVTHVVDLISIWYLVWSLSGSRFAGKQSNTCWRL